MSLGALGYVGFGKEATEGTTVAPIRYLPVSSFDFEDTNDYITPDQIRGGRDHSVAMPAPQAVSGSMEMELIPLSMLQLLASACGSLVAGIQSTVNAGDATLTDHLITAGNASDTFTFESSAGGILVMRYGGIRVNTLEVKAAFGEIVTATFGLEGTIKEKQAAETSETYDDVDPLHFSGASVNIDGTDAAYVKDFTFNVGNNIDRIGTLQKTRAWRRTELGYRDVGLQATLDFTDAAEYQRFLDESEFAVVLSMDGQILAGSTAPTNVTISIPRVRWNKVGVPIKAGDFLEQSCEAQILKPSGAAIFTMTVTNNETDANYA